MEGKNIAVFGIYGSRAQAERGVDQLAAAGFSNDNISVLLPAQQSSTDSAHEQNTKAPSDTAATASPAGVVSGTLGVLVGIGAMAIPGLGSFIAAGPIMASMKSMKGEGAPGGLVGCLVAMGMPELEAERYEGRVRAGAGGVLLSLHCDPEEVSAAKALLMGSGAEDIFSPGEHLFNTDGGQPKDSDRSEMPAA